MNNFSFVFAKLDAAMCTGVPLNPAMWIGTPIECWGWRRASNAHTVLACLHTHLAWQTFSQTTLTL